MPRLSAAAGGSGKILDVLGPAPDLDPGPLVLLPERERLLPVCRGVSGRLEAGGPPDAAPVNFTARQLVAQPDDSGPTPIVGAAAVTGCRRLSNSFVTVPPVSISP